MEHSPAPRDADERSTLHVTDLNGGGPANSPLTSTYRPVRRWSPHELPTGEAKAPNGVVVQWKRLDHRLGFMLPSKDRHGQVIQLDRLHRVTVRALQMLTHWSGGYTSFTGTGGYFPAGGNNVVEPVQLIISCSATRPADDLIHGIASLLLVDLDQASVLVEVDGNIWLCECPPQLDESGQPNGAHRRERRAADRPNV
jgi:hypothetical protein